MELELELHCTDGEDSRIMNCDDDVRLDGAADGWARSGRCAPRPRARARSAIAIMRVTCKTIVFRRGTWYVVGWTAASSACTSVAQRPNSGGKERAERTFQNLRRRVHNKDMTAGRVAAEARTLQVNSLSSAFGAERNNFLGVAASSRVRGGH